MRREPLLLTDFSMLAQLDLIFNYIDLKVLSVAFLLIITSVFITFFLKNRYLTGKIIAKVKIQLLVLSAVFTVFVGILTVFLIKKTDELRIIFLFYPDLIIVIIFLSQVTQLQHVFNHYLMCG